ncbi:MAG: helix-turn-helix domain-containing protein [Myxococcaceae bacterium]|nr:helix-turn-helix domain-containing protein [Myxococcaceae bacterium]
MKSFQAQTFYELLEVSVGATAADVRSAFDRLSRLYADDQVALYGLIDEARAKALRSRLQEAAHVLLDEERRARYDASIGLPPREVPRPRSAGAPTGAPQPQAGWGGAYTFVTSAPASGGPAMSTSFTYTVSTVAVRASGAVEVPAPVVPSKAPVLDPPPAPVVRDAALESTSRAPSPALVRGPAEAATAEAPAAAEAAAVEVRPAVMEEAPAAPARTEHVEGLEPREGTTAPAAVQSPGDAGSPSATETSDRPQPGEPASERSGNVESTPMALEAEAKRGDPEVVKRSEASSPSAGLVSPPVVVVEAPTPSTVAPSAALESVAAPMPDVPPAAVDEASSPSRAPVDVPPALEVVEAPRPSPVAPDPVIALEPDAPPAAPEPPQVARASSGTEPGPDREAAALALPAPPPVEAPPAETPSSAATELATVRPVDPPVAEESALVPTRPFTPREYRAPERPRPFEVPAGVEFNGDLLRQVRMARGLSLLQLSERTRIGVRHLENIESDRYDGLPALVYLRGMLMNVARELGLDGLRVSKSYLTFVEAHQGKAKG